jgi:class I fructose-bisphosphate aldolase
MPENNGGYNALKFGKTHPKVYSDLIPGDHPIEMTRYQLANCYMGRIGLINSGGASTANDFAESVRTAVINKRAGGMGLILGRRAFQRPFADGVKLLNALQDVYLDQSITIA